jgi:hypothetical protein
MKKTIHFKERKMEKKNETLEQRKKAQAELLKLKKMQSGELAPPPKPSELAGEMTKEEKRENFWFYNRGKVIFAIVVAAILAIMITQCATRPVYDGEVVLFTYDYYYSDQITLMENYFSLFFEDKNGDGKVRVDVINCAYDKNITVNNPQNQNTAQKLQTILFAQREKVIFLLDEESFKYLDSILDEGELFTEDKVMLGENFYSNCDKTENLPLPEGLRLVMREYDEATLEADKKVKASYDYAKEVLKRLGDAQNKLR